MTGINMMIAVAAGGGFFLSNAVVGALAPITKALPASLKVQYLLIAVGAVIWYMAPFANSAVVGAALIGVGLGQIVNMTAGSANTAGGA